MKDYKKLDKFKLTKDSFSKYLMTCIFDISFFTRFPVVSNISLDNILINKFKIIILTKGTVDLITINTKLRLQVGDVCLIPPMCMHNVYVYDEPTESYEIFFTLDKFSQEQGLIKALELQEPIYISTEPNLNIGDIVNSIYTRNVNKEDGSYLECIILIQQILLKLNYYRQNNTVPTIHTNSIEQLINKMLSYVQANEDKPITVNDICLELKVSQSYLYRCSKEVINMSPSDYITYYKMTTAEKYLKDNDLSIEVIGEKLGYSNIYYFSKAFKKHFGISPNNFRKQKYKLPIG